MVCKKQRQTTDKRIDVMYYLKKKYTAKKSENKTKKGKPDLVKKLDKIFSAYIRLRDVMPSGFFVCISCGKIKHISQGDCGHYYSRKHMATRFDEDNCHTECKGCNRFSSDHLIGYMENLTRKIGRSRVDVLKWKHKSIKHYTDYELQQMIDYYKAKAQELRSLKGVKINF